MTERDLHALLERASDHVVAADLAPTAWAAAVARQRHRRRIMTAMAGAAAAAAVVVTTAQLTGPVTPEPGPAPSPATSTTTTPSSPPRLDGTAYDVMPLEGKESQLPHVDVGLPSVIPRASTARPMSTLSTPMTSVVAVHLRQDGNVFHPVVIAPDGTQVVADRLRLSATRDAGGNEAWPLGPRAIGAGGRYAVFPQPSKVVLLDLHDGTFREIPVPSRTLERAGWTPQGAIVARSAEHAWTIDPWKPGATAVAADGAYEGGFRLSPDPAAPGRALLHRYRDTSAPDTTTKVAGPIFDVWGETLGTEERAAAGAFFDQDVTSAVIGVSGPVYQGVVMVDAGTNWTRVLLAPENPDGREGRRKGCCTVLGWADADTVLFRSDGSHGAWILTWNVMTGAVRQAARIDVDPSGGEPFGPLALNVGWRL